MRQIFTLLFFALSLQISAQQAKLLKDINNIADTNGNVQGLVEFQGKLFFSADDEIHGDELWVSDNTVAGTHLFVDIASGSTSSNPRNLTVLGDKLYFEAENRAYGTELWVTDGTQIGTHRVTDINPGSNYSNISNIVVYNNKLYFRANDGTHGIELWTSDGTALGTTMVKDISIGSGNSIPSYLTVYNNKIYFSANDGAQGVELWETDGTEVGTQLVKNISPLGHGGPRNLIVYNNKLYFQANGGTNGAELWESDGTVVGTKLSVDIHPSGGSNPSEFTLFNNKLYFKANGGTNGTELWESDGTVLGTKEVKDINPGSGNSSPSYLTVYNNKLYFNANDDTFDRELWISDGTEGGTKLFKNIAQGQYNASSPTDLLVFNNQLFFSANQDDNSSQLWVTNGTEAGTQQFVQIGNGTNSSNARYLMVYNNEVYFEARDGIHGGELWKSDGTEAGTVMVKDINPGSIGGTSRMLGVMNGKLYFQGDDGVHGQELWETDGTEAGTKMAVDINIGADGSSPNNAVLFDNKLYFTAYHSSYGAELWVSDGTVAGTQLVKDIYPGTNSNYIRSIAVYNNKLYFGANDGIHGHELWESDGTEIGTKLLYDIYSGSNMYGDINASGPGNFMVFDNKFYFSANDGIHGTELWVSDGTVAGTKLIKDIRSGDLYSHSSPQDLIVFQNKLYFKANDGVHGAELWETNGTEIGTQLVADINVGSSGSGISFPTVLNNRLYFRGIDGIHGSELWESDGTAVGTKLAADIAKGSRHSNLDHIVVLNGELIFEANDGFIGDELYKYKPFDCSTLSSTTIYVSPSGSNFNNGTSWAEATSLENALSIAATCSSIQEIWVQQGTYKSGIDRFDTFKVPDNLKIYGGFQGTETSLLERDWVQYSTILSGDIGIPNQISGNTFTLLTLENTENTTIDGFVLEEGNAELDESTRLIRDTSGGAVFLKNSNNNTFNHCVFRNNHGEDGAAVYQVSGTGNEFVNCLFYENEAQQTNPVFIEAGTASIVNGTLANNTATTSHGILGAKDGILTFSNSILEGSHPLNFNTTGTGSLTTNYSYLKGENPSGTGNIDGTVITDVKFKDAINNDFSLQSDSPLIDKGNNAANTEINGLGGNDRIIDGDLDTTNTIDIGAYEYSRTAQVITFNALAEVTYGDANFDLTATSDSGLTATYSSLDTSVATVSGNTVTIVGVGTTTITASQVGNTEYLPASDVAQDLKVNPKPITVTADADQTKVFGDVEPVLTYSITTGSLVGSDVLSGNLERTSGEDVGLYPINQGTLVNTNYDITFVADDFEITKADQIITFNSLTDVIYGDADFNLNATADSGLTVDYASSDTSVATISGNTVTIVGVGTTTITASQTGNGNYNATTDIMQTLTVTPKAITVTADAGQSKVFGSAEPVLTYVITGGSLVGSDVLNGSLARTAGEDVGLYPINQGTLANANYDITFVANDFEITKADQIITFNTLTDVIYGDADFDLNATADSGLAISYASSDTSVATISGNTVTIVGVGTTTITASQAGNGTYNTATDIIQTLTVTPKAITVTADAGQSKVFGSAEPVLTYTITGGGLVGSDVLSGNLERTSGEDVGLYPINQGTLANANYDITFVANDFEITKVDQIITFNALTDVTYGDADFNLNAMSDAGLTISYVSSDTSVATISGSTVTIVGVGTTTISANQAGNGNYNAAAVVSQTLNVIPRPIMVTADAGQNKMFGMVDPVLTYSISQGNLVNGDILTGSLERTIGEDAGLYAINQGTLSNTKYDIAFVADVFEIIGANQTIMFSPINNVIYGDADFNLNATASSGLTVTYSSSDTSVATISGNTVSIVGAGSTIITANQSGNGNFNSAIAVTQTLTVSPRTITVTADTGQNKVYGTMDPILTYTITTGNLINDDVLTGDLERVAGEDVGIYSINAGTLVNRNYTIAFVSSMFEISKANQTITFDELAEVNFGDADFDLTAFSSSGLAITYASSDESVAIISGNTVTIVGEGSAVISAHQPGDENYVSAAFVSRVLTVLPRDIDDELIKVYPNPAVNEIHVSETPSKTTISVYNMDGKLVRQVTNYMRGSSIDVTSLPSGMYLVEMKSLELRGRKIAKKFMKD